MSDEMNNMDCQDIKALLSALVDDEVDAPTRHRAERHVAGCAACRTLLDDAERLDGLMASESAALTIGAALPAGFEAAVIERAEFQQRSLRRTMVTWTGWFAAAASLVLAVMIWSFDRQNFITRDLNLAAATPNADDEVRVPAPTASGGDRSATSMVRTAGYQRRSWTFDGDLPQDALQTAGADSPADAATSVPTMSRVQPATIDPAFDDAARDAGHVGRAAAALAAGPTSLSNADVRTLHSVSLLMETLEQSDLNSFAEVERIRQITEYDELLPKLASMKQRLSASDRAVVRIAESILMRIVRGPVTEQVARELWSDASDLRLSESLHVIGDRNEQQPTL